MRNRIVNHRQVRCAQRGGGVTRRIACREENFVAFLQRYVQSRKQGMQRAWAWFGAPGFHAAQMTLGYVGEQGKLKLAQTSLLTVSAQAVACRVTG
ncbi:hypothetical protein D3C75_1196330 [compost metagenome]